VSMKIAIIGGGIAGTSVAYELVTRGAEVVLIDSSRTDRATAAGAGIIAPIGAMAREEDMNRFSFAAAAYYLDLVAELERDGVDTSYRAPGELLLALSDEEVPRLDEVLQRASTLVAELDRRGVGEPAYLDGKEISARYPLFETAIAGVHLPEIGQIDGRRFTRCLHDRAVAYGLSVLEGEAVLLGDDRGVRGVAVGGRAVEADAVVLAAGAWSPQLTALVGVTLPVYPQRGQIMHLRLPGATGLPSANSFRDHYLLAFDHDRLVIGATREDDSGYSAAMTTRGLTQVVRQGMEFIPKVEQAEIIDIRVGIRPATRDGNPLLGPVPSVERLWVASGYGPQGLTLGPYAGAVLARRVLGEDVAIPSALSPSRF
jgi:D-amino-acid dehydrogenase